MANCPTCKESILNQTPSLIGQTQCNSPCPQEVTCEDFIASDCVFYSGPNLACPSGQTNITNGDSVTEAIETLYDLICRINSYSNVVGVTQNDGCPGYLSNKIISSSLTLSVTTLGSCESLSIEEKCFFPGNSVGLPSTSDGTFKAGWSTYSTIDANFQRVQYSNAKACNIKLRGTAYYNSGTSVLSGNTVIFKLPAGFRPLKSRRFSANFIASNIPNFPISPCYIIILPTGEVLFFTLLNLANINLTQFTISLDGIEFETN